MKLRRLLFAALLAVCFDVAVPFEPSAHGALIWEDDEEEGVRAAQRRDGPGTAARAPSPRREAVAGRVRLDARRRTPRAGRRVRLAHVAHLGTPPPCPSPAEAD